MTELKRDDIQKLDTTHIKQIAEHDHEAAQEVVDTMAKNCPPNQYATKSCDHDECGRSGVMTRSILTSEGIKELCLPCQGLRDATEDMSNRAEFSGQIYDRRLVETPM